MSIQKGTKCLNGLKSQVCVILGSQWGDEGKGKLVDILAEKYDVCGRFNGGANAGHTIVANGKKYAFHLLPCGILYPQCKNILGNGVVVNIPTMFDELAQLDRDRIDYSNRLFISSRAHLVLNAHLEVDARNENKGGKSFLGTTKRGIGPTYATKMFRYGIRAGELINWNAFLERYNGLNDNMKADFGIQVDRQKELNQLKDYREIILKNNMITDSLTFVHKAIRSGQRVLVEGANALMLDIDFGTYPYVTASNTGIGGVSTGLGIPPALIETTIGIVKAYTTRVGEGPFPTELKDELGKKLQDIGHEFGATTGRPRRCGWIDIPLLRYSHMINNYSSINITKLDVLDTFDEVLLGTQYKINGKPIDYMPSTDEELAQVEVEYEKFKGWKTDISKIREWDKLPSEAKTYLARVEELLGIPVSWVGTGPDREAMALKSI